MNMNMISGRKQTYGMMALFLSVAIFIIFLQMNLFSDVSMEKTISAIKHEQVSSLPDGTVLGAVTEDGTVDESASGSTQTLVIVLGIILVSVFSITMIIYKRSRKKSENG